MIYQVFFVCLFLFYFVFLRFLFLVILPIECHRLLQTKDETIFFYSQKVLIFFFFLFLHENICFDGKIRKIFISEMRKIFISIFFGILPILTCLYYITAVETEQIAFTKLLANSADGKLMIFFLFFPENKILLFVLETVSMKWQILFSGEK